MADSLTDKQTQAVAIDKQTRAMARNNIPAVDSLMRDSGRKNTFHGPRLTRSQYDESYDIAGIMRSAIQATGRFKDKLSSYSYGFSQGEKFNPMKAEDIIRDAYKGRYGETMNQTRERYMATEKLIDEDHTKAFVRAAYKDSLTRAKGIEGLIKDGDTMPFYRAFDDQAVELSHENGITEKKAKVMMKDSFEESEGKPLYDWGKDLEQTYHLPKMEAAKEKREAAKQDRNMARPRPRR